MNDHVFGESVLASGAKSRIISRSDAVSHPSGPDRQRKMLVDRSGHSASRCDESPYNEDLLGDRLTISHEDIERHCLPTSVGSSKYEVQHT